MIVVSDGVMGEFIGQLETGILTRDGPENSEILSFESLVEAAKVGDDTAMPRPESFTFLQSLAAALVGMRAAIREQRNLRIHLVITLAVVAIAGLYQVSPLEWALLLLCVGGVLATELMNTAVETVVDLVSPDHHELAGRAKDIAAAAVLAAVVTSVVIGLILFGPRFWGTIVQILI
ncbi:MAG: diacylglycerol kinase family protein [Planctomycetaceae bacterium]|nr:diacylglycerol kinase family protein [Planctomycetaceae bacterium]